MLALRSPRGEGGGWTVVPTTANFAKQKITVNAPQIKEPGFVFVYLSYENAGTTFVNGACPALCGDDINVTHTPNNIIQYNEYYAFQQTTANSWTRENVTGNNFHPLLLVADQPVGAGLITASAFIPVVGPFLSIGLGIADSMGAFDGLYNSFDPK